MPLKEGSSEAVIGHNIAVERHAGKPEAQSIAIAMRKAGKPKPAKDSVPALTPNHWRRIWGSVAPHFGR